MPGRWASAVRASVVIGLLLASLLLALLRVTDPSARRLVELVTLSPLGLPAAAAALVVVVGWPAPRGARAAGVLVATCLLVVHSWWLAPLYAGPRSAEGPASLVVLAQNFEYGDRVALADLVRSADVDVLVLTDVATEQLDLVLTAGVGSRLPYSAGLENHVVHGGAVVFSRFPITQTVFPYGDSESRLVEVRAPGLGTVTIVAIHTRPPYNPDGWRTDHDRVHAALTRLRADEDAAVVLAGDFNATLAHAPMRRLHDLGFTDAAVQVNAGWSPTWPTGGHEQRLGITVPAFAAIDHVLTSPRLVVSKADTVTLPGADHGGVLATISGAG